MLMPKIDEYLEKIQFTPEEKTIVDQIMGRGGHVRSAKPKNGEAAYVWRILLFTIGKRNQDWCMPVCADFDIPVKDYNERRNRAKELDKLVDKILDEIPYKFHHGTNRWGSVFGHDTRVSERLNLSPRQLRELKEKFEENKNKD